MSSPQRRRVLAFERLERKASPCSLLLLVASTDAVPEESQREVGLEKVSAASNWTHRVSTTELLTFIEANTSEATPDRPAQTPTSTESVTADEMMKLDDTDLRSMIVFAAMALDGTGSTLD